MVYVYSGKNATKYSELRRTKCKSCQESFIQYWLTFQLSVFEGMHLILAVLKKHFSFCLSCAGGEEYCTWECLCKESAVSQRG